MNIDEAAALLGPDIVAEIRATVASWPPLTPAQLDLAVQVFTDAASNSEDAAGESGAA